MTCILAIFLVAVFAAGFVVTGLLLLAIRADLIDERRNYE